jgi:hypothetical protein
MQGVVISYNGAIPTGNDPWQCPYNPATGTYYPRTTEFQFKCDKSVTGYAVLDQVRLEPGCCRGTETLTAH